MKHFSTAMILLIFFCLFHSGQSRLVERFSPLQYRQQGTMASTVGQVCTLWVVSAQWLHRGLLRQKRKVCPNLRQVEHCTGERILGDTAMKTLNTVIRVGLAEDRNLSFTSFDKEREPSFRRVDIRQKFVTWTSDSRPSNIRIPLWNDPDG